MKRLFILTLSLFLSTNFVYSKAVKKDLPFLKFNKTNFTLLFSEKNSQTNGQINEYYKKHETYTNWSELVAVHHFPNMYSPIEEAKLFREILGLASCPSAITVFEDENRAILDFILINDKKLPIILEFNVFKFEKHNACGTVAVQYAKRYVINNALEIDKIKHTLNKQREMYLKKVSNFDIPSVVNDKIDKGIYILDEDIIIENVEIETKKDNTEDASTSDVIEDDSEKEASITVDDAKIDNEKFLIDEEKKDSNENKILDVES